MNLIGRYFLLDSTGQQRPSLFSCLDTSKWWWCHDIKIKMTSSKIFANSKKISTHYISLKTFTIAWLEIAQYQQKILRKCHFPSLWSCFFAKHFLINWLPLQQDMTCLQPFDSNNTLDNWGRGYFGFPSPNKVKYSFSVITFNFQTTLILTRVS